MIWRILSTIRNRSIKKNLLNVAAVQKSLLTKIFRRLEGCRIANDYALDRSVSIDEFRQFFPVTDYHFYKPYIEKILNGEQSVLFSGRPVCIAQTGGSTSDPKQFPLGKHLIRSYRQFNLDMAFCYMQDSGNYNILSDRLFLVVASPNSTLSDQAIPVGRATGVMAQIAPAILKRRYVPKMSVILNQEIGKKIAETIDQALLNKDHVRMAAGLTPYLMATFNNLIIRTQQEGHDIQAINQIFPNMKVAFHGGTTFNLYSETMSRLTGGTIDHRNVYSAAEGPIAFQYTGSSPGLVPALDAVFFEFLPVMSLDHTDHETLLLDEIECNIPYYILITTQGGLLRYRIGDQVEFVSKNPPLMRVLGRIEDQIDLSGEKMCVGEASDALSKTARFLGLIITDFIICPALSGLEEGNVRHEWIIESNAVPNDLTAFGSVLEENLFKHNNRYQQLRNQEFALSTPEFRFVSNGTFQCYMEQEMIYGQQKLFHMHNDRVCAERLIQYDKH